MAEAMSDTTWCDAKTWFQGHEGYDLDWTERDVRFAIGLGAALVAEVERLRGENEELAVFHRAGIPIDRANELSEDDDMVASIVSARGIFRYARIKDDNGVLRTASETWTADGPGVSRAKGTLAGTLCEPDESESWFFDVDELYDALEGDNHDLMRVLQRRMEE